MSRRPTLQNQGACFFITTNYRDKRNLGSVPGFYEALADSIVYYSKRYEASLIGYVFMPTHIHLLIRIDASKLPGFMRDFKKFTAQKAANDLGLDVGGIWMPRYDRVTIYDSDVLRTKLNYIHANPVKWGLVIKIEDWEWSSAREYLLGISGLIPVYKDWM